MKIELKNVKHHKNMSEETECFSATVYADGKKVGQVCNHGHGGSHDYQHTADWEPLHEYAKKQNPDGFEQLDALIDEALTDHIRRSDLARLMKTRIVEFDPKDKCLFQTKSIKGLTVAKIQEWAARTKRDPMHVLNLLDFEIALKMYKEYA